jgi:hypothetical protein
LCNLGTVASDDAEIGARNRSSLARLESLGHALADDDLARVIDPPWTPGALFAHLAFWDRFVLERWRLAHERGDRRPASLDGEVWDRANLAALPQWLALPPRVAVAECLAAGRELDALIEGLDREVVVDLIAEGGQRLVDRSIHREEHLGTLESAFSDRWIGERAPQSRSMSRWSTETRWPRSRK